MRVFSNTAMSADGKIATAQGERVAFGSPEDRRRMRTLRAEADAVLVGGQTFRRWGIPLMAEDEGRLMRDRPLINAVLTRRGVVPEDTAARARLARRWAEAPVRLLVMGLPELDGPAHREILGAELRTTPSPDPVWAIDALAAEGCQSVLVEGGGELLFPLVAAGRLDTMYLTLCPILVGGADAPTPLGGPGFSADAMRRLALCDMDRVGDELFLRYEAVRCSGTGTS